jgi:transcriptional regulator GlxA family with amidase domain
MARPLIALILILGARRFNDAARAQPIVMKPVRLPSRHAVRSAIAASLRHGDTSIQSTARRLRVSVRSLQRHLAEIGTSYSEIVAEVRLETACHLLADSNLPLADIASLLGYAGPSSFSRIFMRLMKIQPVSYRQQQKNHKQSLS